MSSIQESLNDISEIRSLMERSTKFLSLSGLSGVSAGLCALAGVIAAQYHLHPENGIDRGPAALALFLLYDALLVFSSAVGLAFFFSWRLAKKKGIPFGGIPGKAVLVALLVPLASGLAFVLILLAHGVPELIPSASLVFYGFALINTGSLTHGEIRALGYCEIALGLIAGGWPGVWIYCWAAGFGILHISYGLYMYWKYER